MFELFITIFSGDRTMLAEEEAEMSRSDEDGFSNLKSNMLS